MGKGGSNLAVALAGWPVTSCTVDDWKLAVIVYVDASAAGRTRRELETSRLVINEGSPVADEEDEVLLAKSVAALWLAETAGSVK